MQLVLKSLVNNRERQFVDLGSSATPNFDFFVYCRLALGPFLLDNNTERLGVCPQFTSTSNETAVRTGQRKLGFGLFSRLAICNQNTR